MYKESQLRIGRQLLRVMSRELIDIIDESRFVVDMATDLDDRVDAHEDEVTARTMLIFLNNKESKPFWYMMEEVFKEQ